jgi:hypothetical protein
LRAEVRGWTPSTLDERSFDLRLTRYLHRMHQFGRCLGVHLPAALTAQGLCD